MIKHRQRASFLTAACACPHTCRRSHGGGQSRQAIPLRRDWSLACAEFPRKQVLAARARSAQLCRDNGWRPCRLEQSPACTRASSTTQTVSTICGRQATCSMSCTTSRKKCHCPCSEQLGSHRRPQV